MKFRSLGSVTVRQRRCSSLKILPSAQKRCIKLGYHDLSSSYLIAGSLFEAPGPEFRRGSSGPSGGGDIRPTAAQGRTKLPPGIFAFGGSGYLGYFPHRSSRSSRAVIPADWISSISWRTFHFSSTFTNGSWPILFLL